MNSGRPLKVSCPNFSREEVDALKSLVGLLEPYLKRPVAVDGGAVGDVRFVNLDVGNVAEAEASGRVIGCAARPRTHRSGTIHLPWRVSEVLAVLSEAASSADSAVSARRGTQTQAWESEQGVKWSFRLRAWPLDFDRLPKNAWRVLAAIMRQPLVVPDICARTGLASSEVEQYLHLISEQGVLNRFAAPVALRQGPRIEQGRDGSKWRSLAGKIGRILGFAQ